MVDSKVETGSHLTDDDVDQKIIDAAAACGMPDYIVTDAAREAAKLHYFGLGYTVDKKITVSVYSVDDYPHECPSCNGPAYINGLNQVDCKGGCGGKKTA